jgi:uncharacterized protein (DUF302 family)
MKKTSLGFEVRLNLPYEQALEAVTAALKTEGFGVLTRIDVKATLKEKIGEDFRPYAILGACNPPLAHRALSTDPEVGLLLPCNVTVEADPAGGSVVRLVDPQAMMQVGVAGQPALEQVASQARQKFERIAQSLDS